MDLSPLRVEDAPFIGILKAGDHQQQRAKQRHGKKLRKVSALRRMLSFLHRCGAVASSHCGMEFGCRHRRSARSRPIAETPPHQSSAGGVT
jgi:hypothetical protein